MRRLCSFLLSVVIITTASGCQQPSESPDVSPTATATPEPTETPTPTPTPQAQKLPDGFVYLVDIDDSIRVSLRYATKKNFTGSVVEGYYSDTAAIMTREAAEALSSVEKALNKQGLGLIVYDAYRPKRAVDYFYQWAQNDDTAQKKDYYPNLDKKQLHPLGFLSKTSSHMRGSAIDLSIYDFKTQAELDMGSSFDYFDWISNTTSGGITKKQLKNRMLLKNVMEDNGFRGINAEWWHFSLKNEPFPDTNFDFDVK